MYTLKTSIEIVASPAIVREKFLDFSQIPNYHPDSFFKSISPAVPNGPLQPGSVMYNVLEGMTINPIVLENSPTCFCWRGTFHGLFNGRHSFRFEESDENPGSTVFAQDEEFTGVLRWVTSEGLIGRLIGLRGKTKAGFESFNGDLKRWVEKSESGVGI